MSDDVEPVGTHNGQAARPPGSAVGKGRRQRRPTGAPPPLPRPTFVTTAVWIVLVAVALAGATMTVLYAPWLRLDDQVNTAALRVLAGARTSWLTDLANGIKVPLVGRIGSTPEAGRSARKSPPADGLSGSQGLERTRFDVSE